MSAIGENIKKYRNQKKYTQEYLGNLIGVTTQDIHSPNEKLVLATVEPQVKLIDATLKKIANL